MKPLQKIKNILYPVLFTSLFFYSASIAESPEENKSLLSRLLNHLKFSGEITRTHDNQYARFGITLPDSLPKACKSPNEFNVYSDSTAIGNQTYIAASIVNRSTVLPEGYEGKDLLALTISSPDGTARVFASTIDNWVAQAQRDTSLGFKELKRFAKARIK